MFIDHRKINRGIIFHAIGLYTCLIYSNNIKDRIKVASYGGMYFNNILFVSFIESIIGVILGLILAKLNRKSLGIRHPNPLPKYLKMSVLQIFIKILTHLSSKCVNTSKLIIGKSFKLIPLIIMNLVIFKTKFGKKKSTLTIILTAVGMFTFIICEDNIYFSKRRMIGSLITLSCKTVVQGFSNAVQNSLFKENRIHAYHFVFYNSIISAIILFFILSAPLTNEISSTYNMVKIRPCFGIDLLHISLVKSIGYVFLFSMTEKYGNFVVSSYNVSQKILELIIYGFWYGKPFNLMHWVTILTIVFAITKDYIKKKQIKDSKLIS